ncbi:hypothetical protein Micbo1qcDRAFT_186683 [Microdochium bolleyi]|uniref:FAD-binding PCMH-type domain-containing protein n=1 Tax=Microdochium bolleyi TaxID=196109 RepID=A0A136IKN0_9PEZI|nr:hypothetical protein Micbo1qcDRAFT_186683 [Microdochium bolleyi]
MPSEQCTELASEPTLQGKVYMPDTAEYDTRLGEYYSANAALAPSCMVLPMTTEDVSLVAATIHKNKRQFGMRTGGHSAFPGSNSVEGGVTVDFGDYMNVTTYSTGDETAVIQGGSTWGQAYATLDPFGVTVAGGRASVVGVGGFITGGGYSFHSSAVGFACDTVRNFEIVLANGTVVNANANENSDLWLLRREDVQVTNKLWAGFIAYQSAELPQVYQTYVDFVNNMDSDPDSQALLGMVANESPVIQHSALNSVFSDTINNIVPIFTGPTPLGLFSNWIVEMYSSDVRVITFIDEALARAAAKMRDAAPSSVFQVLLELQPVTPSIVCRGAANGGDILGLESVIADGHAVMFLIALTVDTAEHQDIILPLTLEFRDEMNAYANTSGLNKNGKYAPYAFAGQDPLAHYGAENIALMQAVSRRYDPTADFQILRRSGFKIPGLA